MFGRPSVRPFDMKTVSSNASSCLQFLNPSRCFAAMLGFPTEANEKALAYGEPRPLEPMPPCLNWEGLPPERRMGISHLEVGSVAKEGCPGWVNQDATCACAGEDCESNADIAAGSLRDGSLFMGVFDGHGKSGHEVASVCARRLPEHLVLSAGGPLSNPQRSLEAAFRKTDDDIYQSLGSAIDYSGSTGVVVLMDPSKRMLHVGNVGDSRAVIGQYLPETKSWRAVALTTDLKPDIPKERERIEVSGGFVMALEGENGEDVGPARVWDSVARQKPGLAVSRSLGDGASRCLGVICDPVVTTHRMVPEDRFLLIATDGLWDTLGNDQAVTITAKYLDRGLPQVAVKALTETVRREEGGQLVDDTTLILVVF